MFAKCFCALLVSLLFASLAEATDAAKISVELTQRPKDVAATKERAKLPAKMSEGKLVVVDSTLKEDFLGIFKSSLTTDNGMCKVTCSYESGGIECPVGKAAICGCPGGYLSCECR